jgi:hypothetical protein
MKAAAEFDRIAMKAEGLAALALLVSCSIGHAAPLAASAQTEVARFAATTVTADQSARAVVSNLVASASDSNVTCHMQVTFFGSDGAVINKEEQALKPGASSSIVAKAPRGLLRATISIEAGVDASEPCDLIARLEIYDVHTGTTFISIAPDTVNSSVKPNVTSSVSGHKVLNRRHRFRRIHGFF